MKQLDRITIDPEICLGQPTRARQVPEMAFLADMNISPLTVAQLKGRGWNIIRSSDVMEQSGKGFRCDGVCPRT